MCLLRKSLKSTILEWHTTFRGCTVVLKKKLFFVKDLIHVCEPDPVPSADTLVKDNKTKDYSVFVCVSKLLCAIHLYEFLPLFQSPNVSV